MTNKIQILINIVLTICFAFSVYTAIVTNSLINKIAVFLYHLEKRESEYQTRKEEVLKSFEAFVELEKFE